MPRYRQARLAGGSYFFTVVARNRQPLLCRPRVRRALRQGIERARALYPFTIDAWVLLPDHLHCIWTLPQGDCDYPRRWAMIKRYTVKSLREAGVGETRVADMATAPVVNGTIWQRRYWEHCVRGDDDYRRCLDYLHYNPVKHGYAQRAVDWPYSTFQRWVRAGIYPPDWGGNPSLGSDLRALGE